MKTQITHHRVASIAGTLLVFPAVYFVSASILYLNWGLPGLWNLADPSLVNLSNGQIGWNINLLILVGPMLALVWNTFSLVQINWNNSNEQLQLSFRVHKHWSNIYVAIVSLVVLASIFVYVSGQGGMG
jgi:hypothetical protein